ncbi:MAG: hypothetical protein LBT66_07565 [Methanobrevibacter sp.]|jgi:hypothetical protein|nr:hypothetical protein [Candidatus Methanovirga meridionalis]
MGFFGRLVSGETKENEQARLTVEHDHIVNEAVAICKGLRDDIVSVGSISLPARLYETRAVRYSTNSGRTWSTGMGKRGRIGGYSGSGRSESHQEWRLICGGKLNYNCNDSKKRIVFIGAQNRIINTDKVINVSVGNKLEVSVENRQKTMIFDCGLINSCALGTMLLNNNGFNESNIRSILNGFTTKSLNSSVGSFKSYIGALDGFNYT